MFTAIIQGKCVSWKWFKDELLLKIKILHIHLYFIATKYF